MNKLQLPPKRYEDPSLPIYDSIRHKEWFPRLLVRRLKIPVLAACREAYNKEHETMVHQCAKFEVDEREFRDYIRFVNNGITSCSVDHKTTRAIIELAYNAYCNDNADDPFTRYLEHFARMFGVPPRHITELWETDNLYRPEASKPFTEYEPQPKQEAK